MGEVRGRGRGAAP